MNYDYEAIDNRKIKYSDDIYFLNYNENFELWLNREKVKSFDTLRDVNNWLFQTYVNKRPAARVYVYTVLFREIMDYYKNTTQFGFKITNKKNNTEPMAFKIFGGITYKNAKYYLGTDKTDKINPANYCDLIKMFHNSNIRHNFTSSLNERLFKNNDEMKEFGNPENLPFSILSELYNNASLAPIIYSEINKEFENIYCYDFDSAYIAQYFQCKFPYKFTYTGTKLTQGSENFVRAKFINIRAKNPRFLSLSVANRKNGKNIIFMDKQSKRVLMADEVVVSFFYNLDMDIINYDYEYDEIIIEAVWKVDMKPLPKSFRDVVLELYKTKEEAKKKGEPYADKKVLLNRIHGFFLTKSNVGGVDRQIYASLPAQIGFYTIARQRRIMRNLIEKIGLENIISAHTDSIKTKGCFDAAVEEYNKTHRTKYSDTLGMLQSEGVMEKVVYFSNTRAKYIMDGVFKTKHGGIDEFTNNIILKTYTYETLNNLSPYPHTLNKIFKREEGRNYLYRITENRVFSEGV